MVDFFWRKKWSNRDYLMNKVIFLLLCVVVLGTFFWALIATSGNDGDNIYMSCPVSNPNNPFGVNHCVNKLYHSSDCGVKIPSSSVFCTTEFISAGESLGVKPPWVLDNFWTLILVEFVLLLGINHLWFNKGFFKGFEVKQD